MKIKMITLTDLVPSPDNVRKTGAANGIEELAASIAAHGLLQNLQVRKADSGKFEVVAGGRRLAALNLLAKRKAVAPDAPIPCHIVEDGISEEISLAENAVREDMHPADQYEAFAKLHHQHGMNAEDIAARERGGFEQIRMNMQISDGVYLRRIGLHRLKRIRDWRQHLIFHRHFFGGFARMESCIRYHQRKHVAHAARGFANGDKHR